jgi:hypothetical protein
MFDKVGEGLWDCGEEAGARRFMCGVLDRSGRATNHQFVACAHNPRFTYHDGKIECRMG